MRVFVLKKPVRLRGSVSTVSLLFSSGYSWVCFASSLASGAMYDADASFFSLAATRTFRDKRLENFMFGLGRLAALDLIEIPKTGNRTTEGSKCLRISALSFPTSLLSVS